MNIIQVENLNKSYCNGIKALDNFNLIVQKSEIFSLLGDNGAGKSTLIKILTTLTNKDSGKVNILGYDLDENPMDIRKRVAAVSQNISIDSHLSLEENMLFQSRLYHVPKKEAKERMLRLIDSFDLHDYKDYPVNSYSGGIKRRLDIAMNMMSNPEILFLDEPTVGMDIKSRKSMWKMIKTINKDYATTIFLTTHYLEEADNLSDNILIMKNGRDIICDNPQNLRKKLSSNLVEINFQNRHLANKAFELLRKEFNRLSFKKNIILVNYDFYTINKFLLINNIDFEAIKKKTPTIEEIFLDFTNTNGEDYYGHN